LPEIAKNGEKDHGKMPTGKQATENCNWKIRQRKNDRVGKKGNVKLICPEGRVTAYLGYRNNASRNNEQRKMVIYMDRPIFCDFSRCCYVLSGGGSVESVLKKKKKEGYGGEVGQQCREIIKG